jgi:hypothetical protein
MLQFVQNSRTRWSLVVALLLVTGGLAYAADPITVEDGPNDFFFLFTPIPTRGPDFMDLQRVVVNVVENELIFQLKPYGQLRRLTTASPDALGSYSFYVDVDANAETGTKLRAFPGYGVDVQVELEYLPGTFFHQLNVGPDLSVEVRPSGPAGPLNLEFNDILDTITFRVNAPQLQDILTKNGSTAMVNPAAMKWFVLTTWALILPGCFPPPPVLPPFCVVVPIGDIVPNEAYKPNP